MAKEQKKEEAAVEEMQEQISRSAQWIEDNANLLSWIVCGIVVVVCGFIALNRYVFEPKSLEASDETAKAIYLFDAGNYEQALNGDDNEVLGFAEIADSYKLYKAGKLAALYAGICEYKLGEYDEAAKYLSRFDADDINMGPAAKMLLGDAYVELEDYSKAAKAFEAAAESQNDLIAPMALKKAGFVYMEQGKEKAAQKAFEQIKNNYPQSNEAQDIDKYIIK